MNAKLLLDTHVVLWLYLSPERLQPETLGLLALPQTTRYVSPVSCFELATKCRLGKLPTARELLSNWSTASQEMGLTILPLTAIAAIRAGTLDWSHRDPWDRLLAAQAITTPLPLVTVDPAFADLPMLTTRW